MEKSGHQKSKVHKYDSSISTTGTTTASPPYSDNIDNLKYANANFIDNSESSTQAKDALLDFQKIQNLNFEQHSKHLKPHPSKILPSTLPLTDKKSETIARASDSQLREKSLLDMGFKPNEVEGWEQIVQPPKDNLYKLLKNMIDNYIKPNVQIRIGGVTFNCHMMVLQCYSDFFMDCNNEVLIQLPEEKITPTAFMMVYDWMLAEQPLVQREGILELFNAANFLRIKELINQCWLCLDDDARFREDTAFLLYLEARKYCLESLEQLMLMRICKFFLTLVASKEFLILSAREVCALLSSNTIGVNSETEIFMSVVRWLSHNWEERKCHMLDLIRCVRFSLMPPWFLVTLTKNPECPEIDHIVNHAEVRNMINDGITYTTTQFYYGEKREDFLQCLERFQLLTPMQRQWVFDKECNYHHRLECPNLQYVTYKSFLEYLDMILSIGKDYWRTLEMAKGVEKNMQCCVPADCRKPADPNLTEYLKKASRDQGIQCENASTRYCNKYWKGANNKMQSRTGISVSTCRRTPRANPRCAPTVTTYTKSETEYALQDGESDAYNGNDQDAIKNHVAQQPIMLECINANDCCSKPQPHRYFRRLSKSRQSKHLTSEDIKTVIFKTNETNDNKSLGGGDCCGGGGNWLNVDAATKQHVLHDNDEDVKLHMRSILDCNDNGKQNDSDNDDDDGDYRTKIDGRTNAAKPINKSKEFFEKRQHLFKSVQMTESLERYARVDNKILVIGGIDPYCSHCLHENQPQPQKQQGSRMVSIEHPKNSINNVNVNNKDTWFPNCGDQVLIYDISVMEWRHLSYIPLGSRHHHSAVLCDGLIYVIGGTKTALGCTKKSTFEKSIWCFDPTTLKWVFESSLPESRRDFAVIAINEQTMCSHCQDCKDMSRHDIGFFIIGGESTNGVALNSVWFYSMRRKIWIKKAPLNKGRYGFAAAVVNNEIWVAGGIVKEGSIAMGGGSGSGGAGAGAGGDCGDGDGDGDDGDGEIIKTSTNVITDTIEIYNLKCIHESNSDTRSLAYGSEHGAGGDGVERFTGQWIPLKLHLRMPRLFGRFCVMGNGGLYLVGGLGFDKHGVLISLSDIDNFDFERKQWWHCGDLKWPRHGHDVGIINDYCIVAVGGVSTFEKRTLNKVETFCTQTRKCLADLPDLSFPLSGCAVVTIQ